MSKVILYGLLGGVSLLSAQDRPLLEEQLSAGSLKPEHEQYITTILSKMGVKERLAIRQPLEGLAHAHADFYTVLAAPCVKRFYVNQEWFESMTEPERRFSIGREGALLTHSPWVEKTADAAGIAVQVGTGVGIYKLCTAYKLLSSRSGWLRVPVKIAAALVGAVLTGKIYHNWVKEPVRARAHYASDKRAALELKCLPEAVQLLKRLSDEPLVKDSTDSCIAQLLPERIKRLEALIVP